jgi:exodeoxyribonuclease III
MKQNLKIYSWNINGIRAVLRHDFLKWFNQTKPDILCLQEIKAHEDDIPKEIKELKDYHIYLNSAQKKGYAGTAVLTKIKPLKVIKKIGEPAFDKEGRFLFLEFENFSLLNTYFPHSRRDLVRLDFKQKFNRKYLSFVKKMSQKKPLILTGDFNVAHREIDLKNPQQNKKNAGFTIEERKFVDQLLALNFIDTFRYHHPQEEKYTWWSYRFHARDRNIGWRVDYFFVPQTFIKKIKQAEILDDVYSSDHCPVMISIEI